MIPIPAWPLSFEKCLQTNPAAFHHAHVGNLAKNTNQIILTYKSKIGWKARNLFWRFTLKNKGESFRLAFMKECRKMSTKPNRPSIIHFCQSQIDHYNKSYFFD